MRSSVLKAKEFFFSLSLLLSSGELDALLWLALMISFCFSWTLLGSSSVLLLLLLVVLVAVSTCSLGNDNGI